MKIVNPILWNTTPFNSGKIYIGKIAAPSTRDIDHTDIFGGASYIQCEIACTLNLGPGMLDAAPEYVAPAGGDCHLKYGSPCRDSGDDSAVAAPLDFEGDPRIAYGTVDMGADEFCPHLYLEGEKSPGSHLAIKFIGVPGTASVAFFMGVEVWDPPLAWWPYGLWYLKPPVLGPYLLGPIPSPDGVRVVNGVIPGSPRPPYTRYFHGLIGNTSTNLEILDVQ